jgi:chromosome segregation ATPase
VGRAEVRSFQLLQVQKTQAAQRGNEMSEIFTETCTCDDFCGDPCPRHQRENQLQEERDMLAVECIQLQEKLAVTATAVERVRTERDTVARQGKRDWIMSISFQNQLVAMTTELNRLRNVVNAHDHERSEWVIEKAGLESRCEQLEKELAVKDKEIVFLNEQVSDVQERLDTERYTCDEYRKRYDELGVRFEAMTIAKDRAPMKPNDKHEHFAR